MRSVRKSAHREKHEEDKLTIRVWTKSCSGICRTELLLHNFREVSYPPYCITRTAVLPRHDVYCVLRAHIPPLHK